MGVFSDRWRTASKEGDQQPLRLLVPAKDVGRALVLSSRGSACVRSSDSGFRMVVFGIRKSSFGCGTPAGPVPMFYPSEKSTNLRVPSVQRLARDSQAKMVSVL